MNPQPESSVTTTQTAIPPPPVPLPIPQTPTRVIGLDVHPDSFTAAIVSGPTPAAALVEHVSNKVPLGQLRSWAAKHAKPNDLFLLEASGNSFQIVRSLAAIALPALVLESCQMGKLKEAHANNDKLSAVRIAKAYLAGTAKTVWVPDPRTQERRDWFHAHNKAVKRQTQTINRLRSYLSDHEVRVPQQRDLVAAEAQLLAARPWSVREQQVLTGYLLELRHSREQVAHWESLIAQEVLADPVLLSLTRLCGIREKVAFALGAIIGDVQRFAGPKQLVKYFGLNPAFDDSGAGQWRGGIGGHGRKDVRALLIEAGQAVLRSDQTLGKWGRQLMAAKSSAGVAVAAVARRLTVQVWYLLQGRYEPVAEIPPKLAAKVGKIVRKVGATALTKLGQSTKELRQTAQQTLKTGRAYVLDPDKKFTPKAKPKAEPPPAEPAAEAPPRRAVGLAAEYGLA